MGLDKMKTNRKALFQAVVALAIGIPLSATAGVPTLDSPGFIQDAANNIREAEQWIADQQRAVEEFQQNNIMSKLQLENNNKNAITAEKAAEYRDEKLTRAQAMNESDPDSDACKVVSKTLQQPAVKAEQRNWSRGSTVDRRILRDTDGLTDSEQVEKQDIVNKAMLDSCRQLSTNPDSETDIGAYQTSLCSNVGILMPGKSSLSGDELKAAERINQILESAIPARSNYKLMKSDSPAANQAKMQHMYNDILAEVAASAREDLIKEKVALESGMSELSAILDVSDSKINSVGWLTAISNTDPDRKNDVSPWEVMRKSLAVQAFNSQTQIMIYERLNSMLLVQSAILTRLNEMAQRDQ